MKPIVVTTGAALVLGSMIAWRSAAAVHRRSKTVNGRIVSVHRSAASDPRDPDAFLPTIAYQTPDGYSGQIAGSSNSREPLVGSKVKVSYDPTDPRRAWEHRTAGPYGGAIMLALIGIGVLLYGLFGD